MKSGPSGALEQFKALEDRIGHVLGVLQKTRETKEMAERDLAQAHRQIKLLEKEIERLRKERIFVRDRVQSLIESISELGEKQIA